MLSYNYNNNVHTNEPLLDIQGIRHLTNQNLSFINLVYELQLIRCK